MARFFVPFPLVEEEHCALPEPVVRHLHVWRVRIDEMITLFNGDGFAYYAKIEQISKREAAVHVLSREKVENESPLKIILAQGMSSGERMDFVIQKSVELGANNIYPLKAQKSIVQLKDERAKKRVERWQEIVISACEQSGRNIIPQVQPIQNIDDFLNHLPDADIYLLLSTAGTQALCDLPKQLAHHRVCILVGPEGGWTKDEEQKAISAGFIPILLGSRILRTETAPLAIISALQVLWGDFI